MKLRLGPARQTTSWKKATLNPVWKERFKMPIVTWTPGGDCSLELKVGRGEALRMVVLRCGVLRCSMMWCNRYVVMWCAVVRCDVVWCGLMCYDVV